MAARKLPLVLLLMMVIVSTVCFLPVQEARASIELAYDDGSFEGNFTLNAGVIDAVLFSLPSGISTAKLLTARYYIVGTIATFRVHIMDNDQLTDLTPPFDVTPATTGWFDVDLTSKNIIVTRDFYIVMEGLTLGPQLGGDTTVVHLRSYGSPSLTPPWTAVNIANMMIRAVIDPSAVPRPVGGVVVPANKLEILTPYLALAGLVAAVSAVVVVKKRR